MLARAETLRAEGYTVATPDLFGGRVARTIPEAEALTRGEAESEETLTKLVDDAARDLARTVDRIAIVAWSFGIWYGWKAGLAHPDTVKALVLFYGIGPSDTTGRLPPALAHYAEHDAYEDIARARAVERQTNAAGGSVTVELYPGTSHWFDEPSRPEFDPAASELAWRRSRAFLARHLGAPS